ncbi:MAG: hypothetical protein PHC69_07910 [Ruminiclostridium sp.]|nr:hypothetical protein [Ruminiclostridium sp.]
MATTSMSREIVETLAISQGDIFKNVKYAYIDSEDDEKVNIIELEFPLAIIVSQACDVTFMGELHENLSGKITKFMPSILLCPIYDKRMLREVTHLSEISSDNIVDIVNEKFFTSKEVQVTDNDLHYRFHSLNVARNKKPIIQEAVIDFKHCFSVPIKYLYKNKGNRIASLEPIFAEQITLKFSNYLSRVAIP